MTAAVLDASPPAQLTWSPSVDTNRNAAIVASLKGRARLGLQVRIFLRNLSLRREERCVVDDAAKVGVLWLLLDGVDDVVVGDEVVKGEGFVTKRMIEFRIAGVGGSEKRAFKDIAIWVSGR